MSIRWNSSAPVKRYWLDRYVVCFIKIDSKRQGVIQQGIESLHILMGNTFLYTCPNKNLGFYLRPTLRYALLG